MIQLLAVIFCIAAAAVYAGWRVHKTVKEQNSPCCGCEGCELKNHDCNKKTCEKFGHIK